MWGPQESLIQSRWHTRDVRTTWLKRDRPRCNIQSHESRPLAFRTTCPYGHPLGSTDKSYITAEVTKKCMKATPSTTGRTPAITGLRTVQVTSNWHFYCSPLVTADNLESWNVCQSVQYFDLSCRQLDYIYSISRFSSRLNISAALSGPRTSPHPRGMSTGSFPEIAAVHWDRGSMVQRWLRETLSHYAVFSNYTPPLRYTGNYVTRSGNIGLILQKAISRTGLWLKMTHFFWVMFWSLFWKLMFLLINLVSVINASLILNESFWGQGRLKD